MTPNADSVRRYRGRCWFDMSPCFDDLDCCAVGESWEPAGYYPEEDGILPPPPNDSSGAS